jgi:hypothetical protein
MNSQQIRQLEMIQGGLNIPRYEQTADQTVRDDTGGTQHTQVWKGSWSDNYRWYRRDSTYPGMKRQQIRQLEMIQEGLNIPRYEQASDQTTIDKLSVDTILSESLVNVWETRLSWRGGPDLCMGENRFSPLSCVHPQYMKKGALSKTYQARDVGIGIW